MEKYPDVSSYTYCHNSPIVTLDPDGKDDYKINASGELTFEKLLNHKLKVLAPIRILRSTSLNRYSASLNRHSASLNRRSASLNGDFC